MSTTKDIDTRIESVQDVGQKGVYLQGMGKISDLTDLIDIQAEKHLVRKIDRRIIPFICLTYLVTYIDKATLGYSAVFGLQKDLHLYGTQYSWLSSIFYFGYLAVSNCTSLIETIELTSHSASTLLAL